jgi:hypothetical protein
MKRTFRSAYALFFTAAASLLAIAAARAAADFPHPQADSAAAASGVRTAVLAGGCFF